MKSRAYVPAVGLFLSCAFTLLAQNARFFRIIDPDPSSAPVEILDIGPDGMLTWSNPGLDSRGFIQSATVLNGGGNWTYLHEFVATDAIMSHQVVGNPDMPEGMVLIPGGTNAGTNPLEPGESYDAGGYPETYSLTVDSFYMDQYEVTKALWDEVYAWAITNGYSFDNDVYGEGLHGQGKAADHPVHTVNWYDVVKWCNARSEREGRPAVYTVDGSVYKTSQENNVVQTAAAGYRLPTDVEWEYAARGGAASRRFPWSDADTIQHARANYDSRDLYSYDTSPTRENHPLYATGGYPYTAPVGSFAANGYGLYDMAGNVFEWSFDWYSIYDDTFRVLRGGGWINNADGCRVGNRGADFPAAASFYFGFRAVLPSDQPHETRIIRLEGNLDFGEVEVGQTATRTLTIYNDGSVDLAVTGIQCPAGFSGDCSGVVASGGSQDVTVTFGPGGVQAYDGFLEVISDATEGTNAKNLTGAGIVGDESSVDYLVIDLSGGPSESSYPVSFLNSVPAGGWTDEYKTTKLVLRRISAGTFTMGSPINEVGRWYHEDQRNVTLTKEFYIGVFEVTQRQWERVMGDWPSWFFNADYRETRPLEWRSWDDIRGGLWPDGQPGAGTFMQRISARTGLAFDLPTEAQWEYACRAGTSTALNSGKNLTGSGSCPNMAEVGRYRYNHPDEYSGDRNAGTDSATAKVGSYPPNAWGLYDMHGNVQEWCLDWYVFEPTGTVDPEGAAEGERRVVRGGGLSNTADHCRSADRIIYPPTWRDINAGIRISITLWPEHAGDLPI